MSADPIRPSPGAADEAAGLPKGATIGRYVVLGLLGRGGMGEVYAAYDPELDRKIAVKLLHARGEASTPHGRTRLLREAQAIARLSHPNVVVVYDVGTFQDSVFIAMEFVEGHTLGYWLQATPRSWREVLDVFLEAGKGLVAAHDAGLVHRDFKPDNVMITRDGQVRVMDFGLAREVAREDAGSAATLSAAEIVARAAVLEATIPPPPFDSDATPRLDAGATVHAVSPEPSGGYLALKLTRTGAMLGTPAYMAPEQFSGAGGVASADQFAFSVALYEGLYGHRPFAGGDIRALMANVVAGAIVTPPEHAHVPGWIRKILLRGLSVNPDQRFPSMSEMLAALASDPAARRRRWLALAAGAACVAAVAIGTQRLSAGQRAMCLGGPARAASVWGPAQLRGVERAFRASGHERAAQVLAETTRRLDAYISGWTAMYREACEATQVRGEQSGEVLDLRMGCLGDRLSSVRALSDVLASADRGVVDNAISAAGALPALDRCADVSMLRTVIRPPDDPATRAEVARLREGVAKVNALASAGRCDQAKEVGWPVLQAANRVAYQPITAEISFALGRLFDTCLDTKEALAHLEDALMAATASRHQELAVEASALLGSAYADRTHDVRMGRQWVRLAGAILSGFPGHPLLEARLATSDAVVLLREGRIEEALRATQRAMAIQETRLGPSSIEIAMANNNVAVSLHELGRDEEASASIRRAIAIFADVAGEDSGRVALASSNEAEILTSLGRLDAAQAAIDKALTIWRSHDASSFFLGYGLLVQGKLQLAERRFPAAAATLERSLALLDGQDPQLTAEAEFSLARALLACSPGARKRALELARSAYGVLSKEPATKRVVREIEAWQREHLASELAAPR